MKKKKLDKKIRKQMGKDTSKMKTKSILQIIELVAHDVKDKEFKNKINEIPESEIEKEIDYLLNNRDKTIEILRLLFSENIPINFNFYEKLSRIGYYLGFKPLANKLSCLLLIETYKLLDKQDAQKLLQLSVENKNINFFLVIRTLPIFLSEVEVSPDFASSWLLSMGEKVGDDLAGGDFFKAVGEYAFNFPQSGLKVFEHYASEELDNLRLSLSAIILGELRSSIEKELIPKEIIEKWENTLANDPRTNSRLCYHRSWITSFWRGTVSIGQLESKLKKMLEGFQMK